MGEQKLAGLFSSYGYRPFKLSRFEDYDLYARNRDFLRGTGILTFTDRDGTLKALKPDITLSIVRSNAGKTQKVYYSETVYRLKDERWREIPQAGIECLGQVDDYLEAEVLSLAVKAMRCYADRVILRISDAGLAAALLEQAGIGEEGQPELLGYLASKNEGGIRGYGTRHSLPEEDIAFLCGLCALYAPLRQGIRQIREFPQAAACAADLDRLEALAGTLEAFGTLKDTFLDLSVTNSMDYYNGLVFQGAVAGVPFPVLSGGRYDRLPAKMGYPIGAVGFALYLDEIEHYLGQRGRWGCDLVITYNEGDPRVKLASLAEGFTALGYRVCLIGEEEFRHMNPAPETPSVLGAAEAAKVLKEKLGVKE